MRYNLTEYCKVAASHGIDIYLVPVECEESKCKIGIHLLMPSVHEFEDAIDRAIRDSVPAIYIHNQF